ncbi:MAG: sigma-70 family RNA polymerase sigma factor [Oscillospiraceae bacterium]|nr:sigma-70 family RNA polymerase sigma factor [Oscillospiraceae bacterium]
MEDEEIIALYFARDEKAIAETDRKYGTRCRRLGIRILGNPQDAEECCNDVWLKAWNTIPPQKPAFFSAYLVKLMRNAALNLYEKLHAEKRGGTQTAVLLDELEDCLAAPDDIEAQISEAETGELLRRYLKNVSEEARNIFILRYVYMMPVKDIAEKYEIGVSKVKVSLHRTRKGLREFLGGEQL